MFTTSIIALTILILAVESRSYQDDLKNGVVRSNGYYAACKSFSGSFCVEPFIYFDDDVVSGTCQTADYSPIWRPLWFSDRYNECRTWCWIATGDSTCISHGYSRGSVRHSGYMYIYGKSNECSIKYRNYNPVSVPGLATYRWSFDSFGWCRRGNPARYICNWNVYDDNFEGLAQSGDAGLCELDLNYNRGCTKTIDDCGSTTRKPTLQPSESPTKDPSKSPSNNPTHSPSNNPSESPTDNPSRSPTPAPTAAPTFCHNVIDKWSIDFVGKSTQYN